MCSFASIDFLFSNCAKIILQFSTYNIKEISIQWRIQVVALTLSLLLVLLIHLSFQVYVI